MLDNDQYEINTFLAYRGDPLKRSTMQFEVLFMDGTITWREYCPDIANTVQFENYCRAKSELTPLLYTEKESSKRRSELNRRPITVVEPGDTVYVDLRYFGTSWYDQLGLPDADHRAYIVPFKYVKYANKSRTKLTATCDLLGESPTLDHDNVTRYGSRKELREYMTLITKDFILQFPQILDEQHRQRMLQLYRGEVL
jgi:hypothetical protein